MLAFLALPLGASGAVEVESGDDILIFVAHPDDDILTAAGVAMDHVDNGTGDVVIAYMTNGDRCESQSQVDSGRCSELIPGIGTTRQAEAVAAQEELGVVTGSNDDNLIFLGYPNGFVGDDMCGAGHEFKSCLRYGAKDSLLVKHLMGVCLHFVRINGTCQNDQRNAILMHVGHRVDAVQGTGSHGRDENAGEPLPG